MGQYKLQENTENAPFSTHIQDLRTRGEVRDPPFKRLSIRRNEIDDYNYYLIGAHQDTSSGRHGNTKHLPLRGGQRVVYTGEKNQQKKEKWYKSPLHTLKTLVEEGDAV